MNTTPSSTPHVDAMKRGRPAGGRALVLGGGGGAGNAWELGVVAGLGDAGLDVTEADLIIGTSAGSTVAAQITAANPADLYAAILAAAPQTPRSGGGQAPVADTLEKMDRIIADATDPADMRRRLGAAALERAASGNPGQWRQVVAARLPSRHWPRQLVFIVAVDAQTGEPVVFDRDSGVDVVDAVAASTSGPGAAPHRIGENHYIGGGYRRNENADLAAGCRHVLVMSPFSGRTRTPIEWGSQLATQVDELRAGGSEVETIFPAGDAIEIFAGINQMDPSLRLPAARAGYEQGQALAERLTEFWR